MTTPKTCPKCGCDKFMDLSDGREFTCFTLILGDETLYEGNHCLRTQRDKLAERVKRLEEAGDAMAAYEQGTELGDQWNQAKTKP